MSNETVNFAGEHCWSTRPASHYSSIFWLLSFFFCLPSTKVAW